MSDNAVFVPIYRGEQVVDYAWVDALDAQRVVGYRWIRSGPHAYASGRIDPSLPALKSMSMHRLLLSLPAGHGVVHHINEDGLDNRRVNLKWLPDALAHGSEPHPRRDALCSPYMKDLPKPHERQLALSTSAFHTTEPGRLSLQGDDRAPTTGG